MIIDYKVIYQAKIVNVGGGTVTDKRQCGNLTWKKPGGMGPPGMPSPGGIPPITGLGAAAAL